MKPVGSVEMTEDAESYDFKAMLDKHNLALYPVSIDTLWANITHFCNQACSHCHVNASPDKTEYMNRDIVDRCLAILADHDCCKTLDITGGAPELHPDFDYLVVQARKLKKNVIVRHNLTVITDGNPRTGERKAYLPEFFAQNGVEVLASLPHYDEEITDCVRGNGVFKKSIDGIRRLNVQGYGNVDTGLVLNIVYNHGGPLLPNDRSYLEDRFKDELLSKHGLTFNRLFTVTNMPINRFSSQLKQPGTYNNYMRSLVGAFSDEAAKGVVCRSLISVSYDGQIYDCDFNQMLGMPIICHEPMTVFNFNHEELISRDIRFASHCFGCTAGGGSS